MKKICNCFCLLFILCFFITGCSEMLKELDIAFYGSEEAADASYAAHISSEFKRNEKKANELVDEAMAILRQDRKKQFLYACPENEQLRELAMIRAKETVFQNSDIRPNGLHYFSLYEDFEQLKKVNPMRELRAKGLNSPRDVITYWSSREKDRQILFGHRMTRMQIGLTIVSSTYYWVLSSY